LRSFGVDRWNTNLSVVELFCGRGGGLDAWQSLGFSNLEGVDISASLLNRYGGNAQLYLGDCRRLQLPDASRDIICVQGGMHHLPVLPDDVSSTVKEVSRVLRPGGRFIVVEPWSTPFLTMVHWMLRHRMLRRMWGKLDALACMTEREHETYFNWLGRPAEILKVLEQSFQTVTKRMARGKLYWVGLKR
jgi:ubiquinone/menaquinone biosynthesis C-methylase UbiE